MESKINGLEMKLSTTSWLQDGIKNQNEEISRMVAQNLEKRKIPCRQIACIHGACLRSRCRQGHLISELQASIANHEEIIEKMRLQSLKFEEGAASEKKE